MSSRWRSVRLFCVYLLSVTHVANTYWGLGDPHLVRVDRWESASASSLGARPARQTLAPGLELRESAEQRLLQAQGWGCADVASRRRSIWSRVLGLPSQGEEGSAEVGRGGCAGEGTGWGGGLVQVLRGKFMFIHPPCASTFVGAEITLHLDTETKHSEASILIGESQAIKN